MLFYRYNKLNKTKQKALNCMLIDVLEENLIYYWAFYEDAVTVAMTPRQPIGLGVLFSLMPTVLQTPVVSPLKRRRAAGLRPMACLVA